MVSIWASQCTLVSVSVFPGLGQSVSPFLSFFLFFPSLSLALRLLYFQRIAASGRYGVTGRECPFFPSETLPCLSLGFKSAQDTRRPLTEEGLCSASHGSSGGAAEGLRERWARDLGEAFVRAWIPHLAFLVGRWGSTTQ